MKNSDYDAGERYLSVEGYLPGWGLSADVIVEIGFQSVEAVQDLVNRNAIQRIEPLKTPLISCTLNMLVKDLDLKASANA